MRVISDVQKKSCDLVIMIPAFNEGASILPTLMGLATQKFAHEIRWAILILVNNAPDASQQVRKGNEETLDLVNDAMQGDGFLEKWYPEMHVEYNDTRGIFYPDSLRREMTKLRGRVILCDCSTVGNEIENCNVGRARGIAANVAMQYLDPEGDNLMAIADADNVHGWAYVKKSVDYMRDHPEVDGIRGRWTNINVNPDDRRNFALCNMRDRMRSLEWRVIKIVSTQRIHPLYEVMMPGSNGVFRKATYEKVGGFQPLATCEDTDFSLRILESGGVIKYVSGIDMFISTRSSDRAEGGFGRAIKREISVANGNAENMQIPSLNISIGISKFYAAIERATRLFTSPLQWKEFIERTFRHCFEGIDPLNEQELELLYQASRKISHVYSSINMHVYALLKGEILNVRCGDISAEKLLDQFEEALTLHAPNLKALYAEIEPTIGVAAQFERGLFDIMETAIDGSGMGGAERRFYYNRPKILSNPVDWENHEFEVRLRLLEMYGEYVECIHNAESACDFLMHMKAEDFDEGAHIALIQYVRACKEGIEQFMWKALMMRDFHKKILERVEECSIFLRTICVDATSGVYIHHALDFVKDEFEDFAQAFNTWYMEVCMPLLEEVKKVSPMSINAKPEVEGRCAGLVDTVNVCMDNLELLRTDMQNQIDRIESNM